MLEPNPIRKIGFDILTLVDMDEAVAEMTTLWYGSKETKKKAALEDFGRALFTLMRPRPGAIGALRDLNQEGCVIMFFAPFEDPVLGDRAEKWLQEWFVNDRIELHQIKVPQGQSPLQLDCQVYVLPKGGIKSYDLPTSRPRLGEMAPGGDFDSELVAKLRE